MGLGSLGVCVIVIVCAGLSQTEAATVIVSSTMGIKGRTGHNVSCSFSGLTTGQTFRDLTIFRGTNTATSTTIVVMSGLDAAPVWHAGADAALRNRTTLSGSPAAQYVTITFQDTRCEDKDREYRCEVQITTSNGAEPQTPSTTRVQIEAPPLSPNGMHVDPASVNSSVPEYTVLTFTCQGNVGLPAGSFQWYTFVGTEYTNVTNSSTEVSSNAGTGNDSCTTVKVSRFMYNATRTPYGRNLVVRCRVYHATQGSNNDPMDCGISDTFCQMSKQISVQYPVKVAVSPQMSNRIEGQSVTLMCSMDSNPLAEGTRWYKGDMSNETLSNTTTLALQNLSLNDAGDYTCISFNNVGGKTFNSTATSTLTVSRKPPPTTQPPTTTPSPTTTGSNGNGSGNAGGTSDAAKAGLTDDEVTIIVVVVVVGVVLIIAVIVIVICVRKRRSRKEVEEPPEKPFNNHAGINTLATRPDLVSNDKAYPNAYNNFDNKPRSRRPLALDDTNTDYSDVSMPQV